MDRPTGQNEICVRGLTRTFRVGNENVYALRGVDFDVEAGQFVGVVGVSGSGKSTLLHLLGGLDTPDAGKITVAGQDVSAMSRTARDLYRRRTVGFVFQSFYLVPNLTAQQNIRLALTLQGRYDHRRDELAADAVSRVGLAGRAHHRPSQLSGGEQQRITLARAIVNRPRLLLADEPTGNLDQATAAALMELLQQIRRETGMTILMVTHDEALADRHCDCLLRMRDGVFV